MSTISRISIEQQLAAIGIKTVNAQLHIATPRPMMTIENQAPEMTVESKKPGFKVNWKKVRAESGLKSPELLSKYMRNNAKQVVYEAISTKVDEGDFFGKLEQPGNRVAQFERRRSLVTSVPELNIGLMPESTPEIEWDKGYLNVSWSRHRLVVEWDSEYMPEFSIDPPHSVEVFLRAKPYCKVSVIEEEIPYNPNYPGEVLDFPGSKK